MIIKKIGITFGLISAVALVAPLSAQAADKVLQGSDIRGTVCNQAGGNTFTCTSFLKGDTTGVTYKFPVGANVKAFTTNKASGSGVVKASDIVNTFGCAIADKKFLICNLVLSPGKSFQRTGVAFGNDYRFGESLIDSYVPEY
jgi:hypothetical protein